MISVPAGIQTQLGEAVSVIADSDFWERWDTLVDVSETTLCDLLVSYTILGSRFKTTAHESSRQQWCFASCALDIQEMEALVSVE